MENEYDNNNAQVNDDNAQVADKLRIKKPVVKYNI